MYLLLDECCPKSLVKIADDLGHTAQRTVEIAGLGRQATDAAIFAFACVARGIVVSVNAGDFLALAARVPDHPGLILLPSLRPAETGRLFRRTLAATGRERSMRGRIVWVDAAGRMRHAPFG